MREFLYFTLIWITKASLISNFVDSKSTNENDEHGLRKERALLFPSASTIGILAAIAVPLNDRKNVFLSYNFEANYNSPFNAAQYIPGPLDRLDLVRSFSSSANESNARQSGESGDETNSNEAIETTELSHIAKRSLVNRRNLYRTIERKLDAAGFNGHECLLRTICEAAEIPLGLHNGVLGDIMHIIFTPSSSADENILYDFYDAEIYGTMGMCEHYQPNCSIFDMISVLY